MENQPCYVLKLSLKEIALRRVAVILWSGSDILASIANSQFHRIIYESRNAQEIVEDKVLKLVLPEALKKQIMHIVKPIGLELKGWKGYHEGYLRNRYEDFDVPILEKVYWTTTGTVHYQKTAEALIRCEMLNIVERYKLSCLYCLEDYIPTLWEELPKLAKKYFYNEEDTSHIREPFLFFCWPYILKGEESKLDNMSRRNGYPISFHQHMFDYFALSGNKAAVEYFFRKLKPEEASLIPTAHSVVSMRDVARSPVVNSGNIPLEKYSEVLCYLLSLMTPEQQMEIFKKEPSKFLKCFLDWPWQDLFLEVSDLIWTFLPTSGYDDFLRTIGKAFTSNYCFPKLFQEFFIRSPIDFRKYFVYRQCDGDSFIYNVAISQDSETIEVIFRNIDVEDRVKLVSSRKFFVLFVDLIREDKWHMVEVCLREATLSKEDRDKLKADAFRKYMSEYHNRKSLKPRKRKIISVTR